MRNRTNNFRSSYVRTPKLSFTNPGKPSQQIIIRLVPGFLRLREPGDRWNESVRPDDIPAPFQSRRTQILR